ncbi:NAD(P)-dependent oxidoreductase [Vagococcus fluvialis]|uniref:Hydroxyacid dehydrogenase n=1 Tax=Vagococcus fluvialis TaxID=2738 RepID=A0A7X6DBP7_9ENTE|nr:NAD(P)-dependent oxidoreductase [Vagococcus fluvialis]NKC69183.1 hydroxyacid dehydrogenase [Vagococcus fluvialis]
MKKLTLLVTVPIEDSQVKELETIASNFEIIKLDEFKGNIDDIEILYGWNQEMGNKLLASDTSSLKWVQANSAGVDHIDTNKIKEKNILLSNASGVHGNQMSESILGMIFAHTRKIKEAILAQEKSEWISPTQMSDLNQKKVMIVGTGHIGERLAEILKVFQTNITGVNRSGREVPHFDQIIKQDDLLNHISEMDIVVSLLPDTSETHYFFDKSVFSQMKKGVLFINAGRGGTVNTEDLITYCENETIGFAGLDVFEEEPLPKTSPLWKLDNVLITPHSSGATDQYYNRLYPIFKKNLLHYLETSDISQNKID